MSLAKNDVDEHTLQCRSDHPRSRGNVDGQQEINERWFGSHRFGARSNKISSSPRRWIGTREIFTEDELRPRGTLQGPINGRCRGGRTVQRDGLCGSGLRVPQAGQERLGKRDGTTRQGNGDPQHGGEVVREDRGDEEQDSTSETEASGCEQGPGRHERRITQPDGGPGRPTGAQGVGTGKWTSSPGS